MDPQIYIQFFSYVVSNVFSFQYTVTSCIFVIDTVVLNESFDM